MHAAEIEQLQIKWNEAESSVYDEFDGRSQPCILMDFYLVAHALLHPRRTSYHVARTTWHRIYGLVTTSSKNGIQTNLRLRAA